MARAAIRFSCGSCGQSTSRWMGRCPGCGEWNTLVEEPEPAAPERPGRAAKPARPREPVLLSELDAVEVERLETGGEELDRVLGGGLVPGSIVLIGGSPGIGKSTLMSSTLATLAGS